jgi:SRSO17 transposase
VRVDLVSHSEREPAWNQLVERYHYLGFRQLVGHRLKYLATIQGRPVAALSWSAPALKLRVRDRFIGWSDRQRKQYLHRIASNSRFLVLPWVEVPHLASHVLARNVRRLAQDWREHFDVAVWLLETFVDPRYFQATCYRAANWTFVGITQGSRKQGRGYVHHGARKEVYVYALNPRFRTLIGCAPQPYDPFRRPPRFAQQMEALKMMLRHDGWSPDLLPWMDLTEADLKVLAQELVAFHAAFHDCFGRIEHQRLGLGYLSGLLSHCEAKSVEPIALERLGEDSVRSLQRFLKSYGWDHEAMEATHRSLLAAEMASENGMINVDSSEFLKKGRESVGVARQYCGVVGKVDNCQSGVFVGYSSDRGYGLLTAQLYMPAVWFTEAYETRRNDTLVPEDLSFQTKPQIALGLIEKIAKTEQFPARWIGCDATFGSDSKFLESLPPQLYYFASVRSDTQVFLDQPKVGLPPYKGRGRYPTKLRVLPGEPGPQTVAEVAQSPRCAWTPVVLAEGAKGPIVAEVARLRVYRSHEGLPQDRPEWLFLRRMSNGELKYALSNAPESIAFSALCQAATRRWPIEQCFGDGKGQVGMDHYEHRSWPAWHRHMIYVFLALHFLHRLRVRFKKKRRPSPYPSLAA